MTEEAIKPEPYVGPRPFKAEEKDFFFGRRVEVNDLISLITAYQVVLLYAQSGAGKTSLLRASLLPRLVDEEKFKVLEPARVRSQGETVPLADIRNIFVYNALSCWNNQNFSNEQLATMSLATFFKHLRRSDDPTNPPPMVMVFDQFEEFFTQHLDRWEDRQGFFEQVSEALAADSSLRVYFVMREDYVAELDPYASILPGKLRTRFRMERLRRENALEAIKGPLSASSLEQQRQFEEGVAETLVDDLLKIRVKTSQGVREVPGQFVEPVQLQVVCQTLWQELKPGDKLITAKHLDDFGDVNDALTKFFEKTIKKAAVNGVSEAQLRRWFEHKLITEDGNRSTVPQGTTHTAALPNAAIKILEDERLLRSESRDGRLWFELSQDRLIQPILESNKKWLAERPADEKTHLQLVAQAARFSDTHDPKLLLDPGQILIAKRLIQDGAVKDSDRDTLYALVQASDAEIARAESERERKLAEAQREKADAVQERATALQETAAEQQRRVRQLRWGLAAVSALLFVVAGLAVFALWQRSVVIEANAIAEAERIKAQTAANEEALARAEALALAQNERNARYSADVAAKRAKQAAENEALAKNAALKASAAEAVQRKRAEQSAAESLKSKEYAESSQLTAQAVAVSRLQANSLPNSILLAKESMGQNHSVPAYQVLSEGLAILPRPQTFLASKGINTPLSFSPDGQSLLTSVRELQPGSDFGLGRGSVLVWKPKGEMEGKPSVAINAVDLEGQSVDGSYVATFDSAKNILSFWIWNDTGLHKTGELTGNEPIVVKASEATLMAFSAKGKYLALANSRIETGGTEASISIWDLSLNKEIKQISNRMDFAQIQFNPTRDELVTVDRFGVLRVERFTDPSVSIEVNESRNVEAIAFSPDGKYLAAGDESGAIRILGVPGGYVLLDIVNHQSRVVALTFSQDGQFLASTGNDNTARVWDWNRYQAREIARISEDQIVHGITFNPDGKSIATATRDGFRTWELPGRPGTLLVNLGDVDGFSRGFGDRYLVTNDASTIRVWDEMDGSLKFSYTTEEHFIGPVAISSDGRFLAAAVTKDFSDEILRIWNLTNSEMKEISYSRLDKLIFIPDSNDLLVAKDDSTYDIVDATTLQKRATKPSTGRVRDVSISADGRYLAIAGSKGFDVWDLKTEQRVFFREVTDGISLIAVNRNGAYVVTVSAVLSREDLSRDTRAEVWDLQRGTSVRTLKHDGRINDLSFTSDGKYLATASADFKARIWDLSTDIPLRTMSHGDNVTYVSFSKDGRHLATASDDNSARVWKVESGCEIARIGQSSSTTKSDSSDFTLDSSSRFAFFNSTGDYLIAGNSRGAEMRIWDPDKLLNSVCGYVTRNINADEWYSNYFINRDLPEICPGLTQDKYRSTGTMSCSLTPKQEVPKSAPPRKRKLRTARTSL